MRLKTTKPQSLKRKDIVTDTKLYKSMVSYLTYFNKFSRNTDKYNRLTYGAPTCQDIQEVIILYRHGFLETDITKKREYFERILNKLTDIDTRILIMSEVKIFTPKQYSHIIYSTVSIPTWDS